MNAEKWHHSEIRTAINDESQCSIAKNLRCDELLYNTFIIPAKAFARDYGITGVRLFVCLFVCLCVCLFVCLSVTTITKQNVDGSGRNFLGRFVGGKASPSSFAATIASRV